MSQLLPLLLSSSEIAQVYKTRELDSIDALMRLYHTLNAQVLTYSLHHHKQMAFSLVHNEVTVSISDCGPIISSTIVILVFTSWLDCDASLVSCISCNNAVSQGTILITH